MTFEGDPYRELGVAPGASLNEIKSAYRRLVKKYHPDAAGERALPRFLSIQAAYERLVDGEGRLRPAGGAGSRQGSGGGSGSGGGGTTWRADPGRARASRDAWRARRSGSGGTAGYRSSGGSSGSAAPGSGGSSGGAAPGSGGSSGGAAPGSGTPPGSGATPGSAKAPGGPGAPGPGAASGAPGGPGAGPASSRPPGQGERHHRRGPRTATPGSTSYDEAAETPLDPEWDGGAWYGPTSGTYWTINPREYADPRKHGPEYLARARRAATDRHGPGADGPGAEDDDPAGFADGLDDAGWEWTGAQHTHTAGSAGAWRARAWSYETADGAGTAWTPGREGDHRGDRAGRRPYEPAPPYQSTPSPAEPGAFPDLEAFARRVFPEHLLSLARRPDRRWRLLLALVAWPPIGYALGGLVSTATGCSRYAATCPDVVPVALLLAQPLIVAALFLTPPVAAVAAFAAIAAVAMALPAAAVLSVGALPEPAVEPAVLGVIVAVTYGMAFVAASVRLWGPPRDAGSGADRAP